MKNVIAKGNNQQGFMIAKSLFSPGVISGFSFAPSPAPNGDTLVQEQSQYTA